VQLIAIVNQYFLIAVAVILLLYYKAAQFYRASAREIKRLDNILRSGLYAHFSESLSGLATIRAYGEHDRFLRLNEQKIDMENRAYLLTVFNQRWLGVRLDFFGALLAFAVAIISVSARHSISPSQIGLILSYIIAVQASFSWMVRQVAEVENDMTSTERLLHYANTLEQEAPMEIPATKPVKGWPSQGAIEFSNVVMSYRTGLPAVLKGLSLSVQAGEKIGIVGRTGAGKSSLMQALLRIVELTEGQIVMDGVDISKIGLSDLRQAIAIIPQEALLFNGTIRTNLDPFGVYNDQRLWDALRRAWLVDSPAMSTGATERTSTSGNRFNLDTVIEDEGGNLSVGERSLVSLARALVKDSKVVVRLESFLVNSAEGLQVLDEATASVDYATDSKIQETIRTEFADKTLLCIAHRLRVRLGHQPLTFSDSRADHHQLRSCAGHGPGPSSRVRHAR
jgi:ABC-type multidrug transport system fused ATPase/permease subunit